MAAREKAMKTAIVTGAARGIGLATARKFLAEGWAVALLDIEDATQADCPQTTLALRCDVSDPAAVEAAVAAVGQQLRCTPMLVAATVRQAPSAALAGGNAARVLEAVRTVGRLDVDTVAAMCGLGVAEVLAAVTMLELSGVRLREGAGVP